MTVIINTFWGGKVSQVVDRQISRRISRQKISTVDEESNKVVIVLTKDALLSIAYTGIAVAHSTWMDCIIAKCLAHRDLPNAMIQPGIPHLARPAHVVINELATNLNGKLNSDKRARNYDLTLSIVGFHLSGKRTPLEWEMKRGEIQKNGNRYFDVKMHSLGKFLRENPKGLRIEMFGDHGETIEKGMAELGKIEGFDHDDVENYVKDLVRKRAQETNTVSSECIAVQIDLKKPDSQIQVTFYPDEKAPLLSPWVLTPRLVCAPTIESSSNFPISECGKFVVGGFSDGNTNLNVLCRLPLEFREKDSGIIDIKTQKRKRTQ